MLPVCSFLVIANGIAAAYSFFQVLRCVVSMVRGSVLFNKPLAWAIFSGDQVLFSLHLFYCCAFIYGDVFTVSLYNAVLSPVSREIVSPFIVQSYMLVWPF